MFAMNFVDKTKLIGPVPKVNDSDLYLYMFVQVLHINSTTSSPIVCESTVQFYIQKKEPIIHVRSNNASVVNMGFLVDAALEKTCAVRLDAAELPQS